MITITAVKQALSRMPITSSVVIPATISTAGRLKITGTPNTRGAASRISWFCSAARRSVASHLGNPTPMLLKHSRK